MDHRKYTNIVKAVLHFFNITNCFYSEITLKYNTDLIKIQLHSDEYESSLEVRIDGALTSLIKIRLARYEKLRSKTIEEACKESSFCNATGFDTPSRCINFVKLNPNDILIFVRNPNRPQFNINTIDEQYFQESTLDDIEPIEQYYYIRDMYWHYDEFMPSSVGLVCRYLDASGFDNDEFIDFITTKLWGIIALA